MEQIIWPEFLYTFLKIIDSSPLEKIILDCGAGGKRPPLALFNQRGYQTHGIDISKNAIRAAYRFATENDLNLNIRFGDMRKIPFENNSFSFVYTQNTLCHLSKKDTKIAISEILRVLIHEGMCLIDFVSVDSSYCNEEEMGTLVGDYEFKMKERDEDFYHSFFQDKEADQYFSDVVILRKDKIKSEYLSHKPPYSDVRLYYYIKKP